MNESITCTFCLNKEIVLTITEPNPYEEITIYFCEKCQLLPELPYLHPRMEYGVPIDTRNIKVTE